MSSVSNGAQGRYYLRTSKQEALQGVLANFADAQTAMTEAAGRYRSSVRDTNKAVAYLRKQLQNSWNDVRWQVQWEKLEAAVLSYYQLSLEGKALAPGMRGDWVELAGSVLKGDTSAMAAGHPGLPERHVLETAYYQASAALTALGEAQAGQKAARRTLQTTRNETNHMCRSIVAELRNNLRHLTPQAGREVMRSYGVHFQGDEQEQPPAPDEDSFAPDSAEAPNEVEELNGADALSGAEMPDGEDDGTQGAPPATPTNGTVMPPHSEYHG